MRGLKELLILAFLVPVGQLEKERVGDERRVR
jgi:hypothetical protein